MNTNVILYIFIIVLQRLHQSLWLILKNICAHMCTVHTYMYLYRLYRQFLSNNQGLSLSDTDCTQHPGVWFWTFFTKLFLYNKWIGFEALCFSWGTYKLTKTNSKSSSKKGHSCPKRKLTHLPVSSMCRRERPLSFWGGYLALQGPIC